MSCVSVNSYQINGAQVQKIQIQALCLRGNQPLSISGLVGTNIRDAQDKIRALVGRLVPWPPMSRVIVHLLPSELPKEGSHLELPIILAILLALKNNEELQKTEFSVPCVGSVDLEGNIGRTQIEDLLHGLGYHFSASHHASTLAEFWDHVIYGGDQFKSKSQSKQLVWPRAHVPAECRGLEFEKFWLLCASFEKHASFLLGPPGIGKSHLARWSYNFLPQENMKKILIPYMTQSHGEDCCNPPLIAPHSRVRLSEFLGFQRLGQNSAGYFALAHKGMLVLDEFTELSRDCREILRTVMDKKRVEVNSRSGRFFWPADFWLLLTSNSCPCGYSAGIDLSKCRCNLKELLSYRRRISGPVWDRVALKFLLSEKGYRSKGHHSIGNINFSSVEADLKDQTFRKEVKERATGFTLRATSYLESNTFKDLSQRRRLQWIDLLRYAKALSNETWDELIDQLKYIESVEKNLLELP